MQNKAHYEDWLMRFKRNINGKKFTAVKSYMAYMSVIEGQLGLDPDAIYSISNVSELKKLETRLRKLKTFAAFSYKYQANLLSALHVYQNRMEMLSKMPAKNRKNGAAK